MTITVEARVAAPVDDVSRAWTTPADVTRWNAPSGEGTCPRAEPDLRSGESRFLVSDDAVTVRVAFGAASQSTAERERRGGHATLDDAARDVPGATTWVPNEASGGSLRPTARATVIATWRAHGIGPRPALEPSSEAFPGHPPRRPPAPASRRGSLRSLWSASSRAPSPRTRPSWDA